MIVFLSFCLYAFLSFCPSVFLSFCHSVSSFASFVSFVFLSFCLSVFLSFCLLSLLSFCPFCIFCLFVSSVSFVSFVFLSSLSFCLSFSVITKVLIWPNNHQQGHFGSNQQFGTAGQQFGQVAPGPGFHPPQALSPCDCSQHFATPAIQQQQPVTQVLSR